MLLRELHVQLDRLERGLGDRVFENRLRVVDCLTSLDPRQDFLRFLARRVQSRTQDFGVLFMERVNNMLGEQL